MGKTKNIASKACDVLVEEGGFEPPKLTQQIYSLPPLATRELLHIQFGAGGRIRTPDLLITNQLLYRLSYTSKSVRLSNSKE